MIGILLIYTTTVFSFIVICVLWKNAIIANSDRNHHFLPWLIKSLCYSSIIYRRPGTSGINLFAFVLLITVFAVNVFVLVFRLRSKVDLSQRSVWLFVSNLLLLYFGYRNTILTTKLHVSMYYLQILHRWIGRLCFLLSVTHGVLETVKRKKIPSKLQIAVSWWPCWSSESTHILIDWVSNPRDYRFFHSPIAKKNLRIFYQIPYISVIYAADPSMVSYPKRK
jgi:hypothetical protein